MQRFRWNQEKVYYFNCSSIRNRQEIANRIRTVISGDMKGLGLNQENKRCHFFGIPPRIWLDSGLK